MPDSHAAKGSNVTTLLVRAEKGDRLATEELLPLVYEELRILAGGFLSRESGAQTLQPTALVHEVFIRLIGPNDVSWENRRHFFGAAAKAMRRILMDRARSKRRMKRGEGRRPETLEDAELCVDDIGLDLLALDDALERLAQLDPEKGKLVELKFFGGLSMEEISQILGTSLSTVTRQWRFARVWLNRELSPE